MLDFLNEFIKKYLSDRQAIFICLVIILSFLVMKIVGKILMPVFVSIMISYLLLGPINSLNKNYLISYNYCFTLVFGIFIALLGFIIFIIFPQLFNQLIKLFEDIPSIAKSLQDSLYLIPNKFPGYVTTSTIDNLLNELIIDAKFIAKNIISQSLNYIQIIISFTIYCILVPIMSFFFIKDKKYLIAWACSFAPEKNDILTKVLLEIDQQIGNYIRGKIYEVIIVAVVSFLAFSIHGLKYSLLLSILVGFSVFIPYVGATLVTIPVLAVAFFQWGPTNPFFSLAITYFIIQILDGNVLVPFLFSEAVSMPPLTILIAIIFFGGIWGFWGVFFAIPLATIIRAITNSWPVSNIQA